MIRKLAIFACCLIGFGLSTARAQAPGTDFSASQTSGCGPLTVQFTDKSTNSPTSWAWGFGDGQTSNQQNPSHTYTSANTYTVTLIATNADGTQQMQKTGYITVNPSPTAGFTSNLTEACAPSTIQYTDQSSVGSGPAISSWAWTFGDGNGSPQQYPTEMYTIVGYYDVSLTVTNSAGCSNTLTTPRYLRIVPGVQPNFAFNQTSAACSAPFTGTLVNQTSGPGTLSYNWTVDNGASPASSTDVNPVVTFPAASTYNITLNAISSLGCSASTQQPLTLTTPTPQLNGPSSVCVNEPATFSDGTTPAPNSVAWNFGDGTTANTLTATKTWSAVGSYTVKLVDTYSTCSDSTTTTVQVVNSPTAAFTASATKSCQAPFTVNFTDGTSPTATSWQWNFGDGQTSTVQNPSHTYNTTGSFTVTLTATVGSGCTSTISKTNFIIIKTPTVSVGGVRTACVQGTGSVNIVYPIAFPNTVDGVASYAWTAIGSNEGTSNAVSPAFTYPAPGNFHLLLTITTNGGCTASVTNGIQIGTAVPAIFTENPVGVVCGADSVSFIYGTAGYQYLWNFGDSTTSTIQSPKHSYSKINAAPFNVSLTVTHNGCPDTSSQTLTVNPPIANFGYKVACSAPGNPITVNFIDSSYTDNSPTMTYSWNYGDGPAIVSGSGPYLPPHIYATPGNYTVTLTVTDGTTCSPSIKSKSIILPTVTTSFTPVTQNVCENTGFTLISNGTVIPDTSVIKKYQWTVGTTTGSGPTFTDTIATPGNYPVSLMLTDVNGCSYTPATSSINITGPIAKFAGPTMGGGCRNAPITFTDQSTAYPGNTSPPAPASPINGESWTYGDGTQGTTPVHSYADTGKYNVILKVTDAAACTAVDTTPIQITGPIASFGLPDSFYCPNIPLLFTDSSTGYALTKVWNFGDGSGATTNPHTFAASTTAYNVTLTVTDKYNCAAAATKSVTIQKPVAAFNIYDTTAICTPLQTTFAEHGQYFDSLYWQFGDGSTSTLDSTTHFYNTIDTFTATLFLQGPGGCLASSSRRVLLQNPQKNTKFTYSPVQGCDSVPVQFAITPPTFTNFSLHFDDGTPTDSSGNKTPFHVYRNPGIYGPQVFLTDQTGCVVQVPGQSGQIHVLGATPFFSVNEHSFCDSSTVLFTDYTISNDGFSTETYTFGDGSAPQSQTPGTGAFNISHEYDLPGSFPVSLTVSTTDNCVSTYHDTIRVFQTPHPSIATTGLLCPGPIQFEGNTTPVVDSTIWNWNFGDGQTAAVQNPTVTLAPNTYTITLATSVPFGCKADTTATVTIFPFPSIKGPKEITTGVGVAVTIPFTYGSSITSYNWTPTQNLSCTTCANPVATLIDPTQYKVTVTDSNGCTNSDTVLIKTLCNGENYFLPNTFSPNGDGVNDYFYPRGSNVYNIQSLSVFNRWGQLVFQRRNFPANAENMGWDGTFNGHPAASDAYVYIAEVICENSQVIVLHGSVTLIR